MNALDYTKSLAKEKLSSFGKTFDEVKEERYAQRIDAKQRKADKKLEKFAEQINALPIDKKQELFDKLKDEIYASMDTSSNLQFDCEERIEKPRNREMDADSANAYLWLHALGFALPMGVLMTYFAYNTADGFMGMIASLVLGFSAGAINGENYKAKTITNAINDRKTKRNFGKLESLIDDTNLSTKKMEIVNNAIEKDLESDPEIDAKAVTFTNRDAIAHAKSTTDDLRTARKNLIDDFKARKNKSDDEMEM